MLKQEYAQHIAEMSQRVRCEEWAELEKNKEDFFETGNTWALSWLGHLTVLDAAMYHYRKSGMAGTGKRMPGNIFLRAG